MVLLVQSRGDAAVSGEEMVEENGIRVKLFGIIVQVDTLKEGLATIQSEYDKWVDVNTRLDVVDLDTQVAGADCATFMVTMTVKYRFKKY